ncbi:MAG TPA: FAD-dependent oxidoreductase [Candidatus Thermoplasmatota archaeon]
MRSSLARIDVVGAGAWGLSVALSLLEQDAKNVHVWEREHPGTGATGRAAGLVSTHLRQESDIRLVLETRQRLLALRAWGLERELPSARGVYHAPGNLTTMPSAQRPRLEHLSERIRRAGGDCELIEPKVLRARRWPFIGFEDSVGIHSTEDGYVEAQDLVDLLGARVREGGGTIHAQSPVRLRFNGNTCVGLEGPDGSVDSDHVVLAAGAWSKELLGRSRIPVPIKPYRTQLAQIEYPSHDVPVFHDTEQHVYARPDGPTRILVGDGTEHVEATADGYRTSVDDWFIEKIAAAVSRRFRSGAQARYRTGWAGLCVATPDRDPLIGPYPTMTNLSLMVGDNGFGVMRCIALGRIAAHGVLGIKAPEAKTYDPGRVAMDADFEVREGFEL